MNNEERKLNKLESILNAIDNEYITEDDLVVVVETLKEIIATGDLDLNNKIEDLSDETKKGLSVIMSRVNSGDGKLADDIRDLKEIVSKLKLQKGERGDKGDKGDKGEDGKDGLDGKDGDIKDLAPSEIRDALELLTEDERLERKSIKGLDDYEEVSRLAREPKVINQRGGGANVEVYNATGRVGSSQRLKFTGNASVTQDADGSMKVNVTGGGGGTASAFTDLTDAPASYAGEGEKLVAVKADESGLEFIDAPTGSGAVDSVNGQTGVVVLDADDIDDTSTTNKFVTAGDLTNLSNLSGTNTGDQDLSGYLTEADAAITYEPLKGVDDNYVTDAELVVIGNTSGVNTGDQDLTNYFDKTTDDTDDITVGATNKFNQTHTGDVTGATTLTLDKTAITGKTTVTADSADYVLISDTSNSGNLKKALVSDLVGTGGSGVTNAFAEVPTGDVDGVNDTYTLANTPADSDGVLVLLDGVTQYNGVDYSVVGDTITFVAPPASGSSIFAYYNTFTSGGGGGDMLASTYDPQAIGADAFDRANHTGTQTLSTISDVTATASELNILDGATLTVTELNYVDGVTSSIQTQLDGKAASLGVDDNYVTDAEKTKLSNISVTQAVDLDAMETASHAALTVTDSSEIDLALTGQDLTASLITGSIDVLKLDAGVQTSLGLADSSVQDLSDLGITATASELNTLDGITSTVTELNYTDGVTSAIQTQLDGKQPLDSDLTTIAGLTATTDNFLQAKSSAWASRTPTQVTADLIAFVGDSGSGGTKGLVPAPVTGDATKFLKGDGTWATPTGGSGSPGGSDTYVQFNDGGSFGGDAGFIYDKTNAALTVGGATVTSNAPILNLSQTWNSSGTTFKGILLNITATAQASASRIIDLQVGGGSKFSVDKDGIATFVSGARVGPSAIDISKDNPLRWTVGIGNFTSFDSGISRNAAGRLEINNGTAFNYRDLKLRDIYINGATYLARTTAALTDNAAAATGTLTNAPAAGNPTKWIAIDDNGTTRYIPAW